jgi:hypothetical protein
MVETGIRDMGVSVEIWDGMALKHMYNVGNPN